MARLVECIPNFSISREKDVTGYNALVETAKSVPGCILFDAQSDGNHNRSVLTLLGSPEAVEEAAFQLTKKAAELIDMNHHVGEHSRMGATDVIPFVPTMGVTVEECVEISKRLGQRIWDELKIPSFLYEDSATREERRNLANCRKGQFEGMPEKLLQPEWAPDFGERKIHPTAGITAIGARPPLVAFNVNLATSDVQVAKDIARVIRASSGGFKACKAMGFMLEDRGIAQVSMNMVNTEVTSLCVVYEMIKALAERYGTYVVGSELVGLAPAKALLDCAEFYLKLEKFDCRKQVMEYHLLDMME
ncbi:MAG: glutamate formimidoyltransferase [Fretibacterium sp.]|nr:glutamate formimidoyltransferase [Fretibacterium sp.]